MKYGWLWRYSCSLQSPTLPAPVNLWHGTLSPLIAIPVAQTGGGPPYPCVFDDHTGRSGL